LPDSDGIATFTRIHEACPQQLPIIILTGTGNEEIGNEAISLGAQDYLVKGSADSKSIIRAIRYSIERKHAEVALGLSEEKFAKAFAINPAAMALTRLEDGLFLEVNDTWVSLNGYSRDEVIGQSARKLPIWPTAEAANRFVQELREKGFVRGWEQKFLTKPGAVFVAQLSAQVLAIQGERVILTTMVDITERILAEDRLAQQAAQLQERSAQLEEINKELESFSYSVSHDLRAPLRAIDGYSRMILKKQGDKFDEETTTKFNVIRSNAQQMGQLIDDLLNLSRLGKREMALVKLDMASLTGEVWKELQLINPERDLELKVNDMPEAYGDRTLIRQVYLNLLGNAIKFTKQCSPAKIEAGGYTKGNENVYYIKDNGAGFDMAYYDKLFGVFQRLHTTDEYEGTGIGLAIVQRIIHRHGGRVWAEGEVDKGATFYFTLPGK
jgi:PAS domain S-box-containing protein